MDKSHTPMSPSAAPKSTVVITGVTRGLGRAMVDEFVRLGHFVFGCGRTKPLIEELSRSYPEHDFQRVDVASDKEVRRWAARFLDQHAAPDYVLNNAAVINSISLLKVSDKDFSNVMDINVKGVVNVVRHFAPSMEKCKRGIIVNFNSRWGQQFEPNMGPYCATKWAVVAITRVLAEELKPASVCRHRN